MLWIINLYLIGWLLNLSYVVEPIKNQTEEKFTLVLFSCFYPLFVVGALICLIKNTFHQ